ncbi:HAD-IA family hydrolase [Rubrobacter taiwanensis]|uniref:HAD-IA family hydrolase n=1 Tax=Rubrobacter taiwanensis TaxID=185139 RepID=UPI0014043E7C|nr:HAD-IA family hydrolase [Rubrobacter taiwanensis]
MNLKAVLFDFDGTLVDTTELIYRSMRHASREVLGRELPREVLMRNVGQPLFRQMRLLDPERAAELLEVYTRHNEEIHDEAIREFPGVPGALERLRGAGYRIAVVTSKRRPTVKLALRVFPELDELVEEFVTMEDTAEHKPHPAPLLRALELLGGIPPKEAAYVGDSPYDIAAARAAGVLGVGVSWGAFSAAELRAAGPDALFGDVGSAAEFLLGLGRGRAGESL